MIEFKFKKEKALEAISFILEKSENKKLQIALLVKMIYFSNRECLDKYNFALTGGELYSLPNGPIIEEVLDLLNSQSSIYKRVDKVIELEEPIIEKSLSEAEIEILEDNFKKFKNYTFAQLIDYCHDKRFVPEWKDPGYSRIWIDPLDLLLLIDKNHEEIEFIKESIQEENSFQEAISKYK